MIVNELDGQLNSTNKTFVSMDTIGAGSGETVLISSGSAARTIVGEEESPVDSAIVGIVDTVECL